MNIKYGFASAEGDIAPYDSVLDAPFAVGPVEFHHFMTLRNFFDAISRFLLADGGACLAGILSGTLGKPVTTEEIEAIAVLYQKYGTLYQVCSIDVSGGGRSIRLCANVALTESARLTLDWECGLLAQLENRGSFGYLPRVYKKDKVEVAKSGQAETLFVALLEWFEGYDEWHFQGYNDSSRAYLWDMRQGYRFLSEKETFDTVRQASRILTVYYDVESMERISPWHHGGGDFIVRTSGEGVDVKLVTVRGYEPIRLSDETNLQALCAFCIEIMTKMRLDKWEGMGESTWADRSVAKAAFQGFVEGLRGKEERHEMGNLTVSDVLRELKSFDLDQVRSLVKRLFEDFERYDSSDYNVVRWNLDRHTSETKDIIQSFAG